MMKKKQKECQEDGVQKPQVFLRQITFNDGTELSLNQNSIIVFTGANNSGKSQVLKDIELGSNKTNINPMIVLKNAEFDFYGDINQTTFFSENFHKDSYGLYQQYHSDDRYDMSVLQSYWKDNSLQNNLHLLFINRISTEFRLTSSNALYRSDQPEKHPIYKLNRNDALAEKLSDYFHQAFGLDLVINRNEMETVPLHVGEAPDKTAFTMDKQDDYYHLIHGLPKLQEQGDGMRSFASILLETFTSDYTITLIDEPEAFLHPPQARILGRMLTKNNTDSRQLIISTHSEDFLQGLLDSDNENVIVVRIDRVGTINRMSVLKNNEIKELWGNPLLRYSNILSGLFHKKVIVCESDYDCLFYQAIMDAIYESKNEIAPDVLFTHCGGKTRVKDVVKALKAVNVPVAAICDFDLLNSSQNFKPITTSFKLDWNTELRKDMTVIYNGMNGMNGKSSNGNNAWAQIKKIGKSGFTGSEPAAYERVEALCKAAGLFIVPVGEMECFDKTINKEKKEWVYYVLDNYDLAIEPKLEDARKFVQTIVN